MSTGQENAGAGVSEPGPGVDAGEPKAVEASVKIYGRMLGLYPEHFRDAYGGEMHTLFWDMCHEERHKGRAWPFMVWKKALPDLLVGATAERSKMVGKALRSDSGFLGLKALMVLNGILLTLAGLVLFVNALWVLVTLDLVQSSEIPPSGPHPGWEMILPEKLVTQTLGAVCFCFGLVLAFSARMDRSQTAAIATTAFCGNALIAFAVWANAMQYPTLASWTIMSLFTALAAAYALLGTIASFQER